MTTNATPSVEILNLTTAQTQPQWNRLAHCHTWIFNGQPIDTSTLSDTVDRNTFETCFLNQINVIHSQQGRDALRRLPPVLSQLFLHVNAQTFHASKLYAQVAPYCTNLADEHGLTQSDFVPLPPVRRYQRSLQYDPQISVKTSFPEKEKIPKYDITWESGSNSLVLNTHVTQLYYQRTTQDQAHPLHITRTIQLRFDSNGLHWTYTEQDHLPDWYFVLTEMSGLFHKILPLMNAQVQSATQKLYNQVQEDILSKYHPVRSYQRSLQSDDDQCIRSVRSSRSDQPTEATFFRYPDPSSESFICIAPEIPPLYDITENPSQSGNLIAKVTVVPLLYTDTTHHDTYETLSVTYTYHYRAAQSKWILDKASPIYAYSNDYIRTEWWLAIGCLLPAGGLELSFPQLLPFSGAFIILGCIFIVRARLGDTDSISLPPLDALNHLKSGMLSPPAATSPPLGRPQDGNSPPASPSPATPP